MVFQVTAVVISIIFMLVGLISFLNSLKYAPGSLVRLQRRFSFLNFIGGALFGMGAFFLLDGRLFSPEITSSNSFLKFLKSWDPVWLAVVFLLVGFLFFFSSKRGLEEQITSPLEQFSEALTIYGSKGIFIRLLELGAMEFRLFARKFNEATLKVANDLDITKEYFDQVIDGLSQVANKISTFNKESVNFRNFLDSFSSLLTDQQFIIQNLGKLKDDTKHWFETSANTIGDISNQLLVLSEALNLMTINIAIEAANSEAEQFQEIAKKSREIFQEFEGLTLSLIKEVGQLKQFLQNHFSSVEELSSHETTSQEVQETIQKIIDMLEAQMTRRLDVRSEIDKIDQTLLKINETLPTPY